MYKNIAELKAIKRNRSNRGKRGKEFTRNTVE